MGYSLSGGFISSSKKTPGTFRIPEQQDKYKARGVFRKEHPSLFVRVREVWFR